MSNKEEQPPPRRKPPDRRLGVPDRPLMERDLFAPETSRVLPSLGQIPRRKGSSPAHGAALGANEAQERSLAETYTTRNRRRPTARREKAEG
ncbi:unnamed protein product [Parnassius apollo]|uniref:(apollo) hypothetical protein n=1 Tax=Parnassius apollo TaxID=110799 RepID=A0A8S3WU89_PARAO|nr:unnamed protein product [Parnassius apollo]